LPRPLLDAATIAALPFSPRSTRPAASRSRRATAPLCGRGRHAARRSARPGP
jgi:hypothetical protein